MSWLRLTSLTTPVFAAKIWSGTTTNETFKWEDLKHEMEASYRAKNKIDKKQKIRIKLPPNIYARGLIRNLCDVLYPPSSWPVDGFKQARIAGGVMTGFAPRNEATQWAPECESADEYSSDEAISPSQTHLHAD